MANSSSASTKLLIDIKSNKVLFAEASKDFVDFLFYILSLPVGAVIRLLKKNSMVGSLGNLYGSIENLSNTYMQPNQSKDAVLNPKLTNSGGHVPFLLPNDGVSMDRKFYKCSSGNYHWHVADDPTAMCPQCNYKMSTAMTFVAGKGVAKEAAEGGGFVKGVVTYMVMDDLVVKPMSTISSITLLNKFNVKEIGGLQEKVVSLEMKEGLMLLKASLQCKNVLTSVCKTPQQPSPQFPILIVGEFAMAQLTSEAANQLREGIDLLLGRWSALQMAIQNEWGGRDTRQKAQQLTVDVYQWLIRPSEALYVDELENLLDDFMLSLNTEIDDGSIEEIADNLMIMLEECLEGNFASIGRLRQSIPSSNQHIQVVNGGDDDSDSASSSGDESMEIADEVDPSSNISDMTCSEPPRPPVAAPTVDADGWTVVSSRRNRGSRP
ncbi:hypothetical protein L1987_35100 [Smallanthus sonchifolius]|uniref:Uncharacterized protein n=1 Tax=Smallanthus sonchifolius TaxID=185202 RepID=A0ACB9HYA7_9ASTR|nr:hypothetical protein L1987_35100 [Smallanthus sonchifolius]